MRISKKVKIVYGIVAALFVVMFLLYKVSLNLWGIYTVGKITQVSVAKGGTKVSYEFYVNGKQYGGMITEPLGSENKRRAYFIHYLKFVPSINLLMPQQPADDCYEEYKNKVLDSIPPCKLNLQSR